MRAIMVQRERYLLAHIKQIELLLSQPTAMGQFPVDQEAGRVTEEVPPNGTRSWEAGLAASWPTPQDSLQGNPDQQVSETPVAVWQNEAWQRSLHSPVLPERDAPKNDIDLKVVPAPDSGNYKTPPDLHDTGGPPPKILSTHRAQRSDASHSSTQRAIAAHRSNPKAPQTEPGMRAKGTYHIGSSHALVPGHRRSIGSYSKALMFPYNSSRIAAACANSSSQLWSVSKGTYVVDAAIVIPRGV